MRFVSSKFSNHLKQLIFRNDALYSEHFGYTVSRETINAEETEETTGNVDDWDDDEDESRVRSASARVEQFAGAVGNTSVDGEERFGSDYEEPGR